MPRIDWPVKTLGDICELVSRGRPPSYCEDGGLIVLNQKCVRNGKIDFGPSRRTNNNVKAIPEWAYLREGDTLINSTGTGTLGRTSFVSLLNEPTTFDTHLTVVRPRKDLCWPAFIGLALNGREKDIVELAGGSTGQTELPREAVRSFEIPMPPLDEQRRIVELLDAATACVAELTACYEQARTHAKNLFTSALRELMDDLDDTVAMTLADICMVDWGNTNLTKKSYLENGDYLAVSATGPDGRIGHAEHKAFTPVLSAIGARCGRMFLPEEDFTAIKNTITLTPRLEAASGKYIYFLFEHLSLPIRGAAQPFIAKGDIEKFEVAIPPLSRQEKIVGSLELLRTKTSEMVAAYEAKLTAAKDLRQSILESAFAGEL